MELGVRVDVVTPECLGIEDILGLRGNYQVWSRAQSTHLQDLEDFVAHGYRGDVQSGTLFEAGGTPSAIRRGSPLLYQIHQRVEVRHEVGTKRDFGQLPV